MPNYLFEVIDWMVELNGKVAEFIARRGKLEGTDTMQELIDLTKMQEHLYREAEEIKKRVELLNFFDRVKIPKKIDSSFIAQMTGKSIRTAQRWLQKGKYVALKNPQKNNRWEIDIDWVLNGLIGEVL